MEYIFIKQKDEYCVSQEMFRNFLCVNKRIEFKNEEDNKSDIIIFDGKNLNMVWSQLKLKNLMK